MCFSLHITAGKESCIFDDDDAVFCNLTITFLIFLLGHFLEKLIPLTPCCLKLRKQRCNVIYLLMGSYKAILILSCCNKFLCLATPLTFHFDTTFHYFTVSLI